MYLKSMATGATVEKMERRRKRKRGGRLKQRCWMQEILQALANLNWLEVHSSMYLCVKTDSIYVPPLFPPVGRTSWLQKEALPPARGTGWGGEKPKRMESKVTKYTCVCIFKAAASPASTAAPVLSCPLLRDLDTSPPLPRHTASRSIKAIATALRLQPTTPSTPHTPPFPPPPPIQ